MVKPEVYTKDSLQFNQDNNPFIYVHHFTSIAPVVPVMPIVRIS